MDIYKYKILNPKFDSKKPFVNSKGLLFFPVINKNYKYYLEVLEHNTDIHSYDYLLLLSDHEFNHSCRRCKVDEYGRCQIQLRGEVKEYAIKECAARANLIVDFKRACDEYDVFKLT